MRGVRPRGRRGLRLATGPRHAGRQERVKEEGWADAEPILGGSAQQRGSRFLGYGMRGDLGLPWEHGAAPGQGRGAGRLRLCGCASGRAVGLARPSQ